MSDQQTAASACQPVSRPDPKTERILEASKEIFLELGFAATSMDLVAQRARVSKTTLYTRFPSKEDLFVATITAECDRRGMRFAPDAFDGLPVEEALYQAGSRFVDVVWSPEALRLHQSVTGEAARFPEVAQLYFQAGPERSIAVFAAFFARLAERGVVRIEDPAFAAIQFLNALRGGFLCRLELGLGESPTGEEREAFIRAAVALFLRGAAPRDP